MVVSDMGPALRQYERKIEDKLFSKLSSLRIIPSIPLRELCYANDDSNPSHAKPASWREDMPWFSKPHYSEEKLL